ncbi:hypothetical protein O181_060189 [Austropuccinia psidii MF-1]|uniref:Uncharacterized protein n=1 Tax=Austropuccinia psidii MF-1 TaxID=1389203 RepID=A0A9Q3EFU5_9BASI|nr:hypothetical protein [Austropuccinia psidii MF-1]
MGEPFGKSQIHFFNSFLTLPNFSSPLLHPSPDCPATPHSVIIIDDRPIRYPPPISPSLTTPPSTPTPDLPPIASKNPTASSPRCQAPCIPTMTLTRNSPTCDQH